MPAIDVPAAPFDRIRALLEMISNLRQFFPTLSLADLAAIARAAVKLLPLPDLADEAGCHQWCHQLVGVLDEVAEFTITTIDDSVVQTVTQVIEDDDLWVLLWGLVQWTVSGKVGAPPAGNELAARLNIDGEKLEALIKAIVDFFNAWRD